MQNTTELIGILRAISIAAKGLVLKLMQIEKNVAAYESGAAIQRIYRLKFQRDIYKDLRVLEQSIGEGDEEQSNLDLFSLEMFENIAYTMRSTQTRQSRMRWRSGWTDSIRFPFIRSCRS